MAICNNFSLFLCSRGQEDLYKFSVFEQAILSASNNKVIEVIVRLQLISYCRTRICWQGFKRNLGRVVQECKVLNIIVYCRRSLQYMSNCSRSIS